jgi:hypothetical protein
VTEAVPSPAAPPHRLPLVALALAFGWLAVRVPFLGDERLLRLQGATDVAHGSHGAPGARQVTSLGGVPFEFQPGAASEWTQVRAALQAPPDRLIEVATGMAKAAFDTLRAGTPPDALLVVFTPYPGPVAESLLRTQFERLQNLLYPHPREFRFAQGPAALQQLVTAEREGRLVVVDSTQEETELPAAAEFDLLADFRAGGNVRLRYWLLRKVVR